MMGSVKLSRLSDVSLGLSWEPGLLLGFQRDLTEFSPKVLQTERRVIDGLVRAVFETYGKQLLASLGPRKIVTLVFSLVRAKLQYVFLRADSGLH